MPIERAVELKEQEIQEAAANYYHCLNLSPDTRVLIVTDILPEDLSAPNDANIKVRSEMVSQLSDKFSQEQRSFHVVRFSGETSKDTMHAVTAEAIQKLYEDGEESHPLTVVYLGEKWKNRRSMYKAAGNFAKAHEVRMAGSLGFTTGDCRVMAHMNEFQRKALVGVDNKFKEFFAAHPKGRLLIMTKKDGYDLPLVIEYDMAMSLFEPDIGQFHPQYDTKDDEFGFVFINVPGGERFATPYPFKHSEGYFAASGIMFHVHEGLITEAIASQLVLDNVTDSMQKLALELIRSGHPLPLSELGLGFFSALGIAVYEDSSILSLEKAGPHAGLAHIPGKSTEHEEIAKAAGDFHHTDFVMDGPRIYLFDPDGNGMEAQLYPME